MVWNETGTRTSADTNSSADMNQKQLNENALKGGTPASAPTGTIEGILSGTDTVIPIVGSIYVQYSDASTGAFSSSDEPATFFGGGVWARKYSGGDGEFFKEEGSGDTGGQTRVNGLQPDQGQGWQLGAEADTTGARDYWVRASTRDFYLSAISGAVNNATQDIATTLQGVASRMKAMNDGTNGDPRQGTITEPKNRLIKTWERTS
jgi:hypothetical protein